MASSSKRLHCPRGVQAWGITMSQGKDRGGQFQEMEGEALQSAEALQGVTTQRKLAPAWWHHAEVLEYLRVDHRSLQKAMRETPKHIPKPWVNFGAGLRPRYRWKASEVDGWWKEVNEWRQSRNVESDIGSDGETLTEMSGPAQYPTRGRPVKSRRRSKGHSQGDSGGSLVELANRLTSK